MYALPSGTEGRRTSEGSTTMKHFDYRYDERLGHVACPHRDLSVCPECAEEWEGKPFPDPAFGGAPGLLVEVAGAHFVVPADELTPGELETLSEPWAEQEAAIERRLSEPGAVVGTI